MVDSSSGAAVLLRPITEVQMEAYYAIPMVGDSAFGDVFVSVVDIANETGAASSFEKGIASVYMLFLPPHQDHPQLSDSNPRLKPSLREIRTFYLHRNACL